MAFLSAFFLANIFLNGGILKCAVAQSNVQAFNACMARCHAISCKDSSGNCKNKKLACFAACQQLIKPLNGNNNSRKYR